jgi:hypothetical protein
MASGSKKDLELTKNTKEKIQENSKETSLEIIEKNPAKAAINNFLLQQKSKMTDDEMTQLIDTTIQNIIDTSVDPPILKLLKQIHLNSVYFSIYHNKRFWIYKNVLFIAFRLPLIILSAFNSFFAIGMQDKLPQSTISMANALISLGCGILTSIELFLNLNKKMELELTTYKNYYTLSIDIYQLVQMNNFHTCDAAKMKILDEKFTEIYNRYKELVSSSNAINIKQIGFKDLLEIESDILIHEKIITNNCNVCLCCP